MRTGRWLLAAATVAAACSPSSDPGPPPAADRPADGAATDPADRAGGGDGDVSVFAEAPGLFPRIAAGDGRLWVGSEPDPDADAVTGQVLAIDAVTGEQAAAVAIDGRPTAVFGDGSDIWVANTFRDQLLRIATDSAEVTATIESAAGLSVTGAVTEDALWIGDSETVTKRDRTTGDVLAEVELPDGHQADDIAVRPGMVAVAATDAKAIVVLDPEDATVTAVHDLSADYRDEVLAGPGVIALGAAGPIVTDSDDGLMTVDPTSGEVLASAPLNPDALVPFGPTDIVVAPDDTIYAYDGGRIYRAPPGLEAVVVFAEPAQSSLLGHLLLDDGVLWAMPAGEDVILRVGL